MTWAKKILAILDFFDFSTIYLYNNIKSVSQWHGLTSPKKIGQMKIEKKSVKAFIIQNDGGI